MTAEERPSVVDDLPEDTAVAQYTDVEHGCATPAPRTKTPAPYSPPVPDPGYERALSHVAAVLSDRTVVGLILDLARARERVR